MFVKEILVTSGTPLFLEAIEKSQTFYKKCVCWHRVVGNSMQKSWLTGIITGVYKNKE